MAQQPQLLPPDAPAQDAQPAVAPADFDAALERLEALVSRMERGDMTLERSLADYAEGVRLVKACQQSLEAAQQQVQVLQGDLLRPLNEDIAED